MLITKAPHIKQTKLCVHLFKNKVLTGQESDKYESSFSLFHTITYKDYRIYQKVQTIVKINKVSCLVFLGIISLKVVTLSENVIFIKLSATHKLDTIVGETMRTIILADNIQII